MRFSSKSNNKILSLTHPSRDSIQIIEGNINASDTSRISSADTTNAFLFAGGGKSLRSQYKFGILKS